jgi:hypothetical protein
MAAPGAPGGAPPTYSFAAKQAPVEWRVVNDFHLDPFLSGRDVSPQDLNALDQVASMLEVARIEPPQGVDSLQQAAQLSRLATILQLSSEYQGTRAEVRFRTPRTNDSPFPSVARRIDRAIPRASDDTSTPSFTPARAFGARARAIPLSLPGSDATKIHPIPNRDKNSRRASRRRLTDPTPPPVSPHRLSPSARTSKTR